MNEICKEVIPQFEDDLYDPPKGKSFRELYDVDTLTVNDDYKQMYLEMRAYAESLGIPMPGDGVLS